MKNSILSPTFLAIALLIASCGRVAHAATDEITVGQGHWLYNVRQSLFAVRGNTRIPADHTPLTGRCITAPSGGQTSDILLSQVDLENNNTLSPGNYRFHVFANANSVEGTYVLQFTDGKLKSRTRLGKQLLTTLTVKVRKIAVTGISFIEGEGGLAIRLPSDSDTQTQDQVIGAYEWQSGSLDYPGAFVRYKGDGRFKKIKVRLVGPPNTTYRISASGGFEGIKAEDVRFDARGVAVSGVNGVPNFKIQVFPSVVAKPDVTWQWKATQDGVTTNLNSTSHRIYSVWDTPLTGAKYLHLYEFGCGWASGQLTEDRVVEKIWEQLFSGRIRLARDGDNARYWRYWGKDADGEGNLTNDSVASENYWRLFTRKEGMCGAWATFGAELFNLQGIPAYEYGIRAIRATVTGKRGITGTRFGLLVKDTADHQGDPDPFWAISRPPWKSPRFFENHALTRKNFSLYDPSFHKGPWTDTTVLSSLNKFENESIKNFGVARVNSSGNFVTAPNGGVAIFDIVDNSSVREMEPGQ